MSLRRRKSSRVAQFSLPSRWLKARSAHIHTRCINNESATVAQAHRASKWRHTRLARGFSRNDVMAAILKVWRQIKNPTPSVEVYLCEEICEEQSFREQSCQISSRSIFKRRSLSLFREMTSRPPSWKNVISEIRSDLKRQSLFEEVAPSPQQDEKEQSE